MNFETIIYCIFAVILGMLVFHMLKNVCGCKVVEGQEGNMCPPSGEDIPIGATGSSNGSNTISITSPNPLPDVFKNNISFFDYIKNTEIAGSNIRPGAVLGGYLDDSAPKKDDNIAKYNIGFMEDSKFNQSRKNRITKAIEYPIINSFKDSNIILSEYDYCDDKRYNSGPYKSQTRLTCQSINSSEKNLTNYCSLDVNKKNSECTDPGWMSIDNDSYKKSLRKCNGIDDSNCYTINYDIDAQKYYCPVFTPPLPA